MQHLKRVNNTSFHSPGDTFKPNLKHLMDYRQFLQKGEEKLILPYFEGVSVCDDRRTYRLREPIAPGWYEFSKSGRYLEAISATESRLAEWNLKRLTGYVVDCRLITNELQQRVYGLPEDEDLPRYTPVACRRWFDGNLLYEGMEFEGEAETLVREAYEEERAITEIKGVTPALAHAFVIESTARALAREAERRRLAELAAEKRRDEIRRWQETIEGRISLALSHTGAQLIDWRRSGEGRAIVRYGLNRQRFECVIDTHTLRIVDAGICLDGADTELNLSSLPSAVQEAISCGQLHVFRHV